MRRACPLLLFLAALLPAAVHAQPAPSLEERVALGAAEDADVETLIGAVNAARTLRDTEGAEALFERALQRMNSVRNALIAAALNNELAAGRGVDGVQRTFRAVRRAEVIEPLTVAAWVNSYPELLVGGEFDEMLGKMSADAADPRFRCACYSQKAWMHRVAGDMDLSRAYWDSASAAASAAPPQTPALRAQRVRNLARAGRDAEARRVMREYQALDPWESLPPAAKRNWAQAHAELGDVERAVEVLEELLRDRTLVTPESVRARVSWDGIRSHPAFEAMLARHPVRGRSATG